MCAAAEEVAALGAALAERRGSGRSVAIHAAPTWKGIVELAEQHEAGLIVLGAHRRTGLKGICSAASRPPSSPTPGYRAGRPLLTVSYGSAD